LRPTCALPGVREGERGREPEFVTKTERELHREERKERDNE